MTFGLLNCSPVWPFLRQKLLNRFDHSLPYRVALHIPFLQHGVRPYGGMDRRILTVAPREDVGGAVDVHDTLEIVGQHVQTARRLSAHRRTRLARFY